MSAEQKDVELYQRFFAQGAKLAEDLFTTGSFQALLEKMDELELVVKEAKVMRSALEDRDRREKAKLSKEEREKLLTGTEYTGSDAISLPKLRKERMSRADKAAENMRAAGISEADIKALMSHVKVNPDMVTGGSVPVVTYVEKPRLRLGKDDDKPNEAPTTQVAVPRPDKQEDKPTDPLKDAINKLFS